MAPLPPVSKVVKLVITYTVGSDTSVVNILHFRYAGTAPSQTELAAWLAGVAAEYAAHCAQCAPASVIATTYTATDLSTPSSAQYVHSENHAGTRVGTELPANVAVLVNYHINRRYRGGKPRSYLPFGVGSDVQTGQLWTTAFHDLVQTQWLQFLTNVANQAMGSGNANSTLVNVSYYWQEPPADGSPIKPGTPSTVRPTPQVDDITDTRVSTAFGSQRDRVR